MSLFLIIIGALLSIFCGVIAFSSYSVLKDQKSWDEFYEKIEEENLNAPEEVVYKSISKLNFWASFGTIIGIICLVSGILFTTFK